MADLLFSLVQADFLQSVRAQIADLAATDLVLSRVVDVTNPAPKVGVHPNTVHLEVLPSGFEGQQAGPANVKLLTSCRGARPAKGEQGFGFARGIIRCLGPPRIFAVHCRKGMPGRVKQLLSSGLSKQHSSIVCPDGHDARGASGRFLRDIAQHHSYAWAQVRPLARQVLRSPTLPFPKRRLILNSLAFSAASCTAATWGPLNAQESHAWRTGYVRLVRLLGRDDRHTGQPSLPAESDVCRAFKFASPLAHLKAERILHASRLLLTQSTLWGLLCAAHQCLPDSWLHLLHSDLLWLASVCPESRHLLSDFPDGFAEHALHAPCTIRTFVRKARLSVRAPEHEPLWGSPNGRQGAPRAEAHQCEHCPASFASVQQLSAHKFARHGIRCAAAQYAQHTTVCKSCMMQFWEPPRLLRHLQHDSPQCLAAQEEHLLLEDDLGIWGVPDPPPAVGLPATRLYGALLLPLRSCRVADFVASLETGAKPAFRGGWLPPACRLWLDAKDSG